MSKLRSDIPVEEAVTRHVAGESLRSLATAYGVTVHTLSRHIRRAGGEIRSKHDATVHANLQRPRGHGSRGGKPKGEAQRSFKRRRKGEAVTAYDYIKALRGEKMAIVQQYRNERGCQECGEKHPAVLDLHHTQPKHSRLTKRSVSGNIRTGGYNWRDLSYDDLRIELSKCIVLCSNCHRILEAEEKARAAM